MKTRKKGLWALPLAALLAGIFFLSFLIGRYRVPALQVLRLLTDRFLSLISFGRWGLAPTWTAEEASVVVQIRLPRILSAALIGAALSAAGTSYQAMFRNPMVSPDLLGASTGACFGAALAILLTRCLLGGLFAGNVSAMLFSLLGGVTAMLVMIALRRCRRLSVYGVSVGGAAAHNIGQMAAACITLGSTMVLGYLPFLLAVSLVTGTLTGFVTALLMRATQHIQFR